MAKRKTPKVANLRPEKITEEQLESLHKAINALNSAKMDLGSLEVQKSSVLKSVEGIHGVIESLKKQFEKQYGSHDISVSDGTIKYNEDASE
tara:strand:+ start:1108 stop:1383 length:276 start_codon:yes stop_codon:yes gene_type:complete